MLVDARKGLVLSQNMVTPGDDVVNLIFETVVNYIIQIGRPKNIVVRDAYMASILIDLCEQTYIEVIESSKLHTIDQFVESFYQFRF